MKTAFITGATRNTGWAIAERFAADGWNVIVSSREEAAAQAAARRLAERHPGIRALGVAMDPANVGSIRAAFGEIGKAFGTLDAFVSNAANLGIGLSVLNTSEEDYDAVMNANARGTFFGAQEAEKLMTSGGAMVFISSVHAVRSVPGRICYTASKAAINAMMRSMAVELGSRGIRVNSVIAGAIRSDRWDAITPEEEQSRRDRYPAGRESQPSEIAAAVAFLCSDEAQTITGAEMPVDSGIGVCLLAYDKNWRPSPATREERTK